MSHYAIKDSILWEWETKRWEIYIVSDSIIFDKIQQGTQAIDVGRLAPSEEY